jgi:hypothetical protein
VSTTLPPFRIAAGRPAPPRPRRSFFDKDVLRVGRWNVGGRFWNVSRRTLTRLVLNFQRAREHGLRIPVVWNHSRDARDKIGEVVRLYVAGDTLRAVFWAALPEDVQRLQASSIEMSVEVAEPWVDGSGRVYDLFLTHLAVVNHPVVPAQGPLCGWTPPAHIRLSLTHDQGDTAVNDAESAASSERPEFDAREIVQLVNEIVSALGASFSIPADAPPESLAERLRELRDRIDALVSADEPPALAVASLDAEPTVESLQARLAQVTRRLAIERDRQRRERAADFEAALDRLIDEGRLAAADRPALLESGRVAAYALSLLAPYQRIPLGAAAPTRPLARGSATARAPETGRRVAVDQRRAAQIAADFAP